MNKSQEALDALELLSKQENVQRLLAGLGYCRRPRQHLKVMNNPYEVRLSDTARADFEQLRMQTDASSDASARMQRVQALLDQVAAEDSAASDHVLASGVAGIELRYRSDGSTYLYFRRDQIRKTVVVAFFCELEVEKAGPVVHAPSTGDRDIKILDLQMRDIPQGMEVETAVEMTRANGSKNLVRTFVRKVDWGDFYTVLQHIGSDAQGTCTMIVSGKKGEVEGDWRRDVVEMIELLPDGGVRRHAAQTIPVWVRNPFHESHSMEEVRNRMRESVARMPEERRAEFMKFVKGFDKC